MLKQQRRLIAWFAAIIAVLVVIAILFNPVLKAALSEEDYNEAREEVLISAIPFVAVFVSILLVYILLIVLAAIKFSNKVPVRLVRPVETIVIAGILLGTLGLFQPLKRFGYEYGFVVLLASTLAWILWSHIIPANPEAEGAVPPPPLTIKDHLIGVNFALFVWLLVVVVFTTAATPTEPYGVDLTVWNRMMDEAEQAETARLARRDYWQIEVPLFAFIGLLPAATVYYVVRELAASQNGARRDDTSPVNVSTLVDMAHVDSRE